jgi:hypothetical protein
MLDSEIAKVLAVVSIAGFAIQQLLQMVDPAVMVAIDRYKVHRTNSTLPGGLSDGDFKKSLMTLLGFAMGLLVVWLTGVKTLRLLEPTWQPFGDVVVTALVISGGTEGFNTLLKYVGYVKDARKQALAPVVTVIPQTASVTVGSTFQFTARVDNAPQEVTWELLNNNGGTIDSSGLYTAPQTKGVFQIAATSPADPSRPTLATVTVA